MIAWKIGRPPAPATSARAPSRQLWVMLHRWAGLTMAFFLIVAGATGSVLPWVEELTLASRPSLSTSAPPRPGAAPLDPITLVERVERQTGGHVDDISFQVPTDHVVMLGVAARTGRPALPYDRVWADPYDGRIKLTYRYGRLADGAQNIMPFVYELHYSLALGDWGTWAFGVAALIWTIDCFIGFYLTLPVWSKRVARALPQRSWWSRWRPAWTLRRRAGGHKLNFDLHRAGGLWLWPVLFVFAWSSVGFNLGSVHAPVMRALGATQYVALPALAKPLETPPIGRRAAAAIGERLMRGEAARRRFKVERAEGLSYDPTVGAYYYYARTSLDVSEGGRTALWFSGVDGKLVRFEAPVAGSAADKTMNWFYMLHMAQVFGLPYRIFVSLLGLAVVALSVTGVLIWMKKRSARLLGEWRKRKPVSANRADRERVTVQ